MNDVISNFSRLIAYKQHEPQPRMHKCGKCGRLFKCARCTRVMRYGAKYSQYLTSRGCAFTQTSHAENDEGFTCRRCV